MARLSRHRERSAAYGVVARITLKTRLSIAKTEPHATIEPEVKKTWKEQRRAEIKEELTALTKEDQKHYAYIALEDLKKAGFANPSFARKVQAGDWQTGVLLSKVIEAYALEKYGPQWGVESIPEETGISAG